MRHTDRYWNDLSVGESWTSAPIRLTEEEIVAFAGQFDPQPMHVDPATAAEGRFGGIIASGWHVASLSMRAFVDTSPFGAVPMLGIRIDELCWHKPARPGDLLIVTHRIAELRPSRTRADRGNVVITTAMVNDRDEMVMSFTNLIQMPLNL